MNNQNSLFSTSNDKNRIPLGNNIFIEIKSKYPRQCIFIPARSIDQAGRTI